MVERVESNPIFLERILLLQSSLHAAPDVERLKEMVSHELSAFPGVSDCRMSIERRAVDRVNAKSTEKRNSSGKAVRRLKATKVGANGSNKLVTGPNWHVLELCTSRRKYGSIHLRMDDPEAFAPYAAIVNNTVNLIALHIENSRTAAELNALNCDLDEQVKIRTQQLRESQIHLSEAQRVARLGSFESDLSGENVWWSDQLYYLFGLKPAQYTPTRAGYLAMVHPDDRKEYEAAIERCLTTGARLQMEFRARHSSGKWRQFESKANVMHDDESRVSGIYGIVQDITDRKKAESRLTDQGLFLRLLIDNMPNLIFWKDRNSVYLGCNQAFADVVGLENPQAVIGLTEYDLQLDSKHAEGYLRDDAKVIVTGEPLLNREESYAIANGKEGALVTSKIPIRNAQNKIIALLGICVDITAQKEAEAAIRESNARFSQISEYIDDIFWLIDVEDPQNPKFLYISTAYERIFQRPVADLFENPSIWYEYVHADDKERVVSAFEKFLTGEGDLNHELRSIRANGTLRVVNTQGTLIRDDNGKVIRAAGITRDITDRKLQDALRAGQNQVLEQMISGVPLQSVLETLVLTLEQQTDGMVGSILLLREDDGQRLFTGAAPNLPKEYCDAIDGAPIGASSGSCGTAAFLNERVIVEDIQTDPLWDDYRAAATEFGLRACWSQPFCNSDGDVLGTFALYYHEPKRPTVRELMLIESFAHLAALAFEREQAEEALRKGEKENRALVENAPYCIHQVDTSGRIISMNSAGIKMMTATCEKDVVGIAYLDVIAEADRPRIGGYLDAAQKGESSEFEFESVNGLILASSFVPILDDDGSVVRIMGITQDVTERKRAEKKRIELEAQLRQSHKMEAVGQLAGGVAHDFNNLLTAILGNSEAMIQLLGDSPKSELVDRIQAGIGEIQLAGNHAATLTRQLLAFSRREILRPEVIDPRVTLTEMNALLRRLIGEHIDLKVQTDSDVSMIHADSGQLEQIVMNLVVNAVDSMPDGGPLTIELGNVELQGMPVPGFDDALPGRYVQLSVTDNGTGMSPETLEHVFEPFFTTKPVGKGTGLGLSMVYGIVKQSNGFLRVDTSPGAGTTFRVCFPAIDHAELSARRHPARITERSDACILLCEDEPMVRSVMCKALKAAGFTVIESDSGDAALEVAARHDGPIDLLITDVVMPGMSGSELAEKLVENHPNARVLFVSGYSADHLDTKGVEGGVTQLLQKPFGPSTLVERVQSLITSEGD